MPGELVRTISATRRGILPATAALFVVLGVIHFYDPAIFQRPLLDYDDVTLVAPLEGMSLSVYVKEWLLGPDHYAYPLRDLSFALDFELSRLLGFKTFWLTNFLLYLFTLVVLVRIFGLYYRSRPYLVTGCLGLIALHPINLQMIQWVSNRKHLLVALILGWGTWRALERQVRKTAPTARDWLTYFAVYVAAWLCFPSAALWIFWVLFLFRSDLARRRDRGIPLWAAAIAIAGLAYVATTLVNSDYRTRPGVEAMRQPVLFALQSSGRAVFNLLVPFRIEPYYRLGHSFNWIGLALVPVASWWIYRRLRALETARRWLFAQFMVLAAALYIPNAKVFLRYTEFVWSDRYLHACLPYLVLAALILLVEPVSAPGDEQAVLVKGSVDDHESAAAQRVRRLLVVAFAAVAGAYVVLDWMAVPRWKDGLTLFTSCAREEESSKCVAMAIDKAFDRGGCALLPGLMEMARQIAPSMVSVADHDFRAEVPVYEALCVAELQETREQKLQKIEALRAIYSVSDHLMLGTILVHLQQRDHQAAFEVALATYFNPKVPLPNASPKIINMIRGQGEALCILREVVAQDRSCWSALETFNRRVLDVTVNQNQVQWTFGRSMVAYNSGT